MSVIIIHDIGTYSVAVSVDRWSKADTTMWRRSIFLISEWNYVYYLFFKVKLLNLLYKVVFCFSTIKHFVDSVYFGSSCFINTQITRLSWPTLAVGCKVCVGWRTLGQHWAHLHLTHLTWESMLLGTQRWANIGSML